MMHEALALIRICAFHLLAPLFSERRRAKQPFWAARSRPSAHSCDGFRLRRPVGPVWLGLALVLLVFGITRICAFGCCGGGSSRVLVNTTSGSFRGMHASTDVRSTGSSSFTRSSSSFLFSSSAALREVAGWVAAALAGPLNFYLMYRLFPVLCPPCRRVSCRGVCGSFVAGAFSDRETHSVDSPPGTHNSRFGGRRSFSLPRSLRPVRQGMDHDWLGAGRRAYAGFLSRCRTQGCALRAQGSRRGVRAVGG